MEKKLNRGEIVESSGVIILVTGDRSILAHHFSGVCIESTPDPFYPVGDFSTTWHIEKFNKAYDSLGDWMKSKQRAPGPGWVKASTRLPASWHLKCVRFIHTKLPLLDTGALLEQNPKDIDLIEWLDESGQAQAGGE